MQNLNRKIATAFMVAAFAAPMIASADTASSSTGISTDVQAQIQALLTQIKSLQEQIKSLIASSTSGGQGWGMMGSSTGFMNSGQMGKTACITLNRTLKQGDNGEDVKGLQQMLKNDGQSGFNGTVTGFFGPLTAKAMAMFQMHNGIASSTDGTVGPLTRGFFERHCGNGEGNGNGGQGGAMGGGMGKMQGGMNQGMIDGEITAVGTASITITRDSGLVATINVSSSTQIQVWTGTSTPPKSGTIADFVVGNTAAARGPATSDNVINAVSISTGFPALHNPMMGGDVGHDGGRPMSFMPTTNGPQHGPGTNGGPQNR